MRGASSSSVPQWVCVTARPPLHAYRVCPDRIGIHTHARVHCKCLTVCVLARLHSILLLCANSEYHFALPSAFVCSFEDPPKSKQLLAHKCSLFLSSHFTPLHSTSIDSIPPRTQRNQTLPASTTNTCRHFLLPSFLPLSIFPSSPLVLFSYHFLKDFFPPSTQQQFKVRISKKYFSLEPTRTKQNKQTKNKILGCEKQLVPIYFSVSSQFCGVQTNKNKESSKQASKQKQLRTY